MSRRSRSNRRGRSRRYDDYDYDYEYEYQDDGYDDYDDYDDYYERPRRGHKALFVIFIVLAVLIILAEIAYLAFGHYYNLLDFRSGLSASERAAAEIDEGYDVATDAEIADIQSRIQAHLAAGGTLISDDDVVNILLIGTDARTRTEAARSDAMILVSLNKRTQKIVLTSFMRDIYTYIPDYGYNRLNAPYAIAGADYLIETLEADFGVSIDSYAAVNFYDFADIIDTLGGVDLTLTNAEVDFINGQVFDEQLQLGVGTGPVWLDYEASGYYHLNGTQALAHCRNRSSAGSDADRTDRQRTVISEMITKAKGMSISELNSLLDVVLPMVVTDLTQADCLSLILHSGEYLGYTVESIRIPAVSYSFTTISGMSVISVDFAANAAVIQDAIYG